MFEAKYHHNLVWDKHFRNKGRANDDDDNDTNILDEGDNMNRGTIWTITFIIISDYIQM